MNLTTNILKLLKIGQEQGITVLLDEAGNLKIKKKKHTAIDADLLQALKANKEQIIHFLQEEATANPKSQAVTIVTQANNKQNRPLSFAQERLWFVDEMEGSENYQVQGILEIQGTLDVDLLEQAVNNILNRHEVLRSVISSSEDPACFKLLPENTWSLELWDVKKKKTNELNALIHKLTLQQFDLSKEHMLKGHLLQKEEQSNTLILIFHHIATDAWSENIFIKELVEGYNAAKTGRKPALPKLEIQYADFAAWERKQYESGKMEHSIQYWKQQLEGVERLNLPTKKLRTTSASRKGNVLDLELNKKLAAQLKQLAKDRKVSLFVLMLSAYCVLLYRYTNQKDSCVGTSFANRFNAQVEPLIGLFVKLLAIRTTFNAKQQFTALIQQVNEQVLEAITHKDVPFNKIVELIGEERTPSDQPLFSTLFVYNNAAASATFDLHGAKVQIKSTGNAMTHFDLCYYLNESDSGLSISTSYFDDLFSEAAIRSMQTHYLGLLESILVQPDQEIGQLTMLPADQRMQLIKEHNDLKIDFSDKELIKSLFERQAKLRPEALAVTFQEESISFKTLNERANFIADAIVKAHHIQPNAIIGIMTDHPLVHIVAMVSIWKTGAAYVPIDAESPANRIDYIVKDTQLKVIITDEQCASKIPSGTNTYRIDQQTAHNLLETDPILEKSFTSNHLLYLIYTSGTTGIPKGVKVSHKNILDYLAGLEAKTGINAYTSFAFMSSMSADLGNTVLFPALLNGGNLHVFKKEALTDPSYLHPYFEKHSIDCIKIVPSHWQALELNEQPLLPQKAIFFGGEALHGDVIEKIYSCSDHSEIYNHYGPTETTIGKLLYKVEKNRKYTTVPIGLPFSNTQAYVVTDDLKLCPVGVRGELLLGGLGVSAGYLNQAELTREKFIDNPFHPNAKVYKTGDIVYRNEQGEIVFEGRKDSQVKINGFRVELGGIETVINNSDLVKKAIVIAKGDAGKLRLVVYFVPKIKIHLDELKEYLKQKLPEYMFPNTFVKLDEIPLTRNGKVDKKALPEPQEIVPEQPKQKPESPLEHQLKAIWEKLLDLEDIGMRENFFEIGGHSLIAIRVVLAIRKEIGKKIAIKDLFDYPTIRKLDRFITNKDTPVVQDPQQAGIQLKERPKLIPLSFEQERLWIIDKLEGSNNYHIEYVQYFSPELDVAALGNALKALLVRHEVLRTVIVEEDDRPQQKILAPDHWELSIDTINDESELEDYVGNYISKAFNLSKDYLIRARILKLPDGNKLLILVLHHIVSDVWSKEIIIHEVLELYQALKQEKQPTLPSLTVQYADYALWQRSQFTAKEFNAQLNYWEQHLAQVVPLNFKTDFPRNREKSKTGSIVKLSIDKRLTSRLEAFCKEESVTMYMLLMAAFKSLLFRYTEQTDICIGSPIANRSQSDLENLIGFFLNAIAIRSFPKGELPFKEYLHQLKDTILAAYSNKEVPFDRVVDRLKLQRTAGKNPLFQLWFDLHESVKLYGGKQELPPEILAKKSTQSTYIPSKFDLELLGTVKNSEIHFDFIYDIDLFERATIERLAAHFQCLLNAIVKDKSTTISGLNILQDLEKVQLLETYGEQGATYPEDKTILDLFWEQAAHFPNQIAVEYLNDSITYHELDRKSNQLARHLQQNGLTKEALVLICFERSIEMIIGIFGIMKAGGVYVPVDPNYPQDRINYLLNDSAASFVLSQNSCKSLFEGKGKQLFLLDEEKEKIYSHSQERMNVGLTAENAAYIIYTSGSTGKPKGVVIEHKNIVRLFRNSKPLFDFDQQDVWTLFHSFCFDFSVWEMYGALLHGGRLVIVPSETARDVEAYSRLLQAKQVTVLNQTPSSFYNVQEFFTRNVQETSIRYVIFGGEALAPGRLSDWKRNFPDCKLINMYGITETTVHVTYKELTSEDIQKGSSNIGRALPTLACYILDQYRNIVPLGVAGEIYVSGAGLARGYLNRPSITKQRFISHTFENGSTKKLYRTGDIAKRTTGGELIFLGRTDDQVKMRGYRIELEEIQNAVSQHTAIIQNAVVVHQDPNGNKRLVAYVVVKADFKKQDLLAALHRSLPVYMIPHIIVKLAAIPLTPNGKIDKKALPEPVIEQTIETDFVPPQTETEISLAKVWTSVLNLERVGVHDNFFELGGDSIISIQIVNQAKRSGLDLTPRDIFEQQTIATISKHIADRSSSSTGEQGILSGRVALAPIQSWYFEKEYAAWSHYNQAVLLSLDKSITPDKLKRLTNTLMQYHDVFRLKFSLTETAWEQQYQSVVSEVLAVEELRAIDNSDTEQITDVCSKYQNSLNIEEGRIIKFVLIKTTEREAQNRLFIVVHHLAIDGVSWRILLDQINRGLSELNQGMPFKLSQKTTSYREWVNTLIQSKNSDFIQSQAYYWKEILKANQPIPVDKKVETRPTAASLEKYTVNISKSLTTSLLLDVHQVAQTGILDFLLAALTLTITDWTNRENVVIGLENHGREYLTRQTDLSSTVGWFTSIYPVKLTRSSEDQLATVKEQLKNIPANGMAFGVLRYPEFNALSDPAFSLSKLDLLFNYLGQFNNLTKEEAVVQIAAEDTGKPVADSFPLNNKIVINSIISKGELKINWSYSSQQYHAETIKELAEKYVFHLTSLIHSFKGATQKRTTPSDFGLNPEISIKELDAFWENSSSNTIEKIYRLGALQEGILFHYRLDSEAPTYLQQMQFEFPEGLNIQALKLAFQQALQQKGILRTSIDFDSFRIPVQLLHRAVDLPFNVVDYSQFEEAAQQENYQTFLAEDAENQFDLRIAPLMRIKLFKFSPNQYKMVWTSHHIILDGWSMSTLMTLIMEYYRKFDQGISVQESKVDCYSDYIQLIAKRNRYEQETFWKKYLNGISTSSLLPFVSPAVARNREGHLVQRKQLRISTSKTAKLLQYAQQNQLTVNSIMQFLWAFLLAKYTQKYKVVFGRVTSTRPKELSNSEERIGLYINTLPVAVNIVEAEPMLAQIKRMQAKQMEVQDYQYTALKEIQNWCNIQGEFFDTLMVFENYPVSSKDQYLSVEKGETAEQTNYLLSIKFHVDQQLNIAFDYKTAILEEFYVDRIRQQLEFLLDQFIETPEIKLKDFQILSAEEQTQLTTGFNKNITAVPTASTVLDLIAHQTKEQPQATALTFNGQRLSYQELEEQAEKVAQYLSNQQPKKEAIIAVFLDRSFEMISTLLGILKAGCAYVPLDTAYPQERINYILKDTAASFIISTAALVDLIQVDEAKTILIENLPESTFDTAVNCKAQDLAYVIYTSGSSGLPKGVLIEHGNLLNLTLAQIKAFDLSASMRTLQFSSIGFDASCSEIFTCLASGGTLVIPSNEEVRDPEKLAILIDTYSVDVATIPPSYQIVIKQHLHKLKTLISAGEALIPAIAEDLVQAGLRIINAYGPTENTVCVSLIENPPLHKNQSNIGTPIDNVQVYILNEHLQLLPVGVPGEICVAGKQVARGYLNRPELTAACFVPISLVDGKRIRVYKTGDYGRWLPNGTIAFLGRKDSQVKIRGHRIELGEIEAVLTASPFVKQAVVLTSQIADHSKQLLAYVIPKENYKEAAIRNDLKAKLPSYMIPDFIIDLEYFPLNSSGKVDRKALPLPANNCIKGAYAAPQNAVHRQLAVIWEKLLNLERVGINDSFFDIGGHSILVARLVSEIRVELNVSVPVSKVYEFPTIADLYNYIRFVNKSTVENKSSTKSIEI